MPVRKVAIFQGKQIRRQWDSQNELWYFSVVDVAQALTDQPDFTTARKYWNKLAERLRAEGSEVVTKCHQLKLRATDGKMRLTDVADTEVLLRIVQVIPSPKAEPFKLWLARVGYERLEETADPELAINRALKTYLQKGYSKEWINQRLKSIEIRKELTDEWETRGVKEGLEFAILTNEISQATFGKTVEDYKKFKKLKRENLRDHMDDLELIFSMLGEASTTEIAREDDAQGFDQNKDAAIRGGGVAGQGRKQLEKETNKKVISPANFKEETRKLEDNA